MTLCSVFMDSYRGCKSFVNSVHVSVNRLNYSVLPYNQNMIKTLFYNASLLKKICMSAV